VLTLNLNNFATNGINPLHTNSFQGQSALVIPPVKTQMINEESNSNSPLRSQTQTQLKMMSSPPKPDNGNHWNGNYLTTSSSSEEDTASMIVSTTRDIRYVDITEFLNLPQTVAAKKLDIPTSTLSKRWKEAVRKRKWPYRTICKLDKEITTLLHNVPQSQNSDCQKNVPLPPEVEQALAFLLKKRQEELKTVIIRL